MVSTPQGEHAEIQGGMPVVGSDGSPIGTVDHLDGEFIRLARSDDASGGRHRWLSRSLVAGLEDGQLRLSVPAAQAEKAVLDEDEAQRRMTMDPDGRREFGQPDDGGGGPRGSRAQAPDDGKAQRGHTGSA
ncbi:DUF2171 domain-containing protein [Roseicella aquatilis]|uniref:DUF2171 domain-containing protein n=1 Tax=Roseicella aquatilis TaxID=2527868 RepID=A0A4R4DU74_9PROT|nr:DUF2171 domain-containing protein [Roseicella aquatilis]TCZ63700.1 DUF2171 domain-containing protein [Roseicella aquatilis]